MIFSTYSALLKSGWTMGDIDKTDIFGYWRVRAWEQRGGKKRDDGPVYIDDLFWGGAE